MPGVALSPSPGTPGPPGPPGPPGAGEFVFRPAEPAPSGNVFASWPLLVAAAAAQIGPKIVYFDGALAPCVIPAGAWNFAGCTTFAACRDQVPALPVTISDGATLVDVFRFDDVAIDSQSTGPFVIDAPPPPAGAQFTIYSFNGSASVVQSGAGGTFIRNTFAAPQGLIVAFLDGGQTITGAPLGAVARLANPAGFGAVAAQDFGIVAQDTLAAVGPNNWAGVLQSPAASISTVQAGCPGGVLGSLQLASEAARVNYNDTPPLIGATDVQAAIDALKGGALIGNPNALGYFNPAGNALTSAAALTAAPVDPFGRPQIRDDRIGGAGPVFRQGAWSADGDPDNNTADGLVVYGPNALGAGPSGADGGYARVKPGRFGLAQIQGGGPLRYGWRTDWTQMFSADDAGTVTFSVQRATGDTYVAGKLTVVGAIDPVSLSLSDPAAGTALFIDSANGVTAPVSAASHGRLRYAAGAIQRWQLSENGGPWTSIASLAWPVLDSIFDVQNAGDPTKQLQADLSGQAAGTTTTITTTAQASRPFRLPDISGTAIVQQDASGQVFVGIGVTGTLHGSNAGLQYSTTTANRAQYRGNQYGANNAGAGMTTFKSRGAAIGALGPVLAADLLGRWTSIGVAADGASIQLAATVSVQVPAGYVSAPTDSWVPTEYEVALVALAGPANSRRPVQLVTSEGETRTLRGVRAGGPSTLPTALGAGTLWSSDAATPNGAIVGSPGDLWSASGGGPGATLWVKESGLATNTGWVAASGTVPPFAFTLYVDGGTAVAVADQNGSAGKPYSTIQAAVNRAQALGGNTAIVVTAGTYLEQVTIPDLDNLSIIGAGMDTTIVRSANATVRWTSGAASGATVHRALIRDLAIEQTAADGVNGAIDIDGNANNAAAGTGTFLDRGIELVRVRVRNNAPGSIYALAANFWTVGKVVLTQCDLADDRARVAAPASPQGGGITRIRNCTNATIRDASRVQRLELNFTAAGGALVPATLRGAYEVTDDTEVTGQAAGGQVPCVINGHPVVRFDDTTRLDLQTGAAFIALGADGASPNPSSGTLTAFNGLVGATPVDYMPEITFDGWAGADVRFTYPAPVGGVAVPVCKAQMARVTREAFFERKGAARLAASWHDCIFSNVVTAIGPVDLDIRGSDYAESLLQTDAPGANTGAIDRDHWSALVRAMPIGGANVIPIDNPNLGVNVPFPAAVGGAYIVTPVPNSLRAAIPFVTLKTAANFTVTVAAGDAGKPLDLLLTRSS